MNSFPLETHPMVFLLSADEGVLFDPQGRFHGWIMRRHPDGMWTSVRKLEAVDPEDHPLIRAMQGFEASKEPCGECHLHPGETCDICGAKATGGRMDECK